MKRSKPRKEEAFTIPELVTGLVIAGVVVTAGISLSSMIQRSSREDLLSTTEISKTDVALNQIVDEVNQSKKVLIDPSELPSGCSAGGGDMFLAFQLPAQAYGKGEYQTQNTSTGAKTIAEQNALLCPIVIGLKSPARGERGPRVVYRYGPGIDSKGFYQPTSIIPVQTLPILEGVSTNISGAPMSCRNGWKRIAMYGFEACIDPYRRTVEMSVSKVIPTATGALSRFVKRTAAGSTRSLDSSLVPVTDSSGGVGGGTSFFGQYGSCDGTSFLIDNSGSMSWGNNRMEVAKRELMAAIDKCPDGARINVLYFNSTYGAFSSTNTALNSSSRSAINQFISNIYPGGGTNPWDAINALMTNQSVKRIVLLTDGDTWTYGSCIGGGQMEYSNCYANYNANNRPGNPVKIDAIALDTECNSGYGHWLSPLSSRTGGSCVKANA